MSLPTTEGFEANDDSSSVQTINEIDVAIRRGWIEAHHVVDVSQLPAVIRNTLAGIARDIEVAIQEQFDCDDVTREPTIDVNPVFREQVAMKVCVPFDGDRDQTRAALSIIEGYEQQFKLAWLNKVNEFDDHKGLGA